MRRASSWHSSARNDIGDAARNLVTRRLVVFTCLSVAILLVWWPQDSIAASWTKQTSKTFARLHAVQFLDENRGFVAGGNGTILTTLNGGETWEQLARPTGDSIVDLQFVDPRTGWIVCERDVYQLRGNGEFRTYLMKTVDGGATWTRIEIGNAEPNSRLGRTIFTRSGRAISFGEGGFAFLSRDGGASWIRRGLPTKFLVLGGTFLDDNFGCLVGANSTIAITSDAGETWRAAQLVEAERARLNAVNFVDARQGWAVGSSGTILVTRDGGRAWHLQDSNTRSDLLDVNFVDVLEGWAVGTNGTVLHTIDSGIHWTEEPSGTAHPLNRIFAVSRDRVWAVGFGGTILSNFAMRARPAIRG